MSYKALYRVYRPSSFKDVVGQAHITRTFKNALEKNKIAHAYLFTGPRGTGKTSVAKIIAKAVNCELAPVSEPCNECSNCKSINTGFDSDVFEIDAASNNGVDEIREIRDKVKYSPTHGRFKVYIIDEVHMLSTGAFNALLKTLEEPPKHVIFILATTEPHKIPATIISRCQRFDFRSISINHIVKRIKDVISNEDISVEEQAIITIAKNAKGGMRDALSLLDQAISFSDDYVTEENVHEITGTVSEEKLYEIAVSLHQGQTAKAISIVDELLSLGKEVTRLIEDLIYYYRDLLLIQKLDHLDKELITNYSEDTKALASAYNSSEIFNMISILNNAQYEMKKTNHPRVFIELALFRASDAVSFKGKMKTTASTKEETFTTLKEALEAEKKSDTPKQEVINGSTTSVKQKNKVQEIADQNSLTDNDASQDDDSSIDEPNHIRNHTEKNRFNEVQPIEQSNMVETRSTTEQPSDSDIDSEHVEGNNNANQSGNTVDIIDSSDETEHVENITQVDQTDEIQKDFQDTQANDASKTSQEETSASEKTNANEPHTVKHYIDVTSIEHVLNNGDKRKRKDLAQRWHGIYGTDLEMTQIEQLLMDGSVEAVSTDNHIILSYEYDSICSKLYDSDIRNKAISVLRAVFNEEFNIIAIPERVWNEKKEEFINQFKNNVKRPKLKPISEPILVKSEKNKYDHEPEMVKKAIDLFGEEVVKIKK